MRYRRYLKSKKGNTKQEKVLYLSAKYAQITIFLIKGHQVIIFILFALYVRYLKSVVKVEFIIFT